MFGFTFSTNGFIGACSNLITVVYSFINGSYCVIIADVRQFHEPGAVFEIFANFFDIFNVVHTVPAPP